MYWSSISLLALSVPSAWAYPSLRRRAENAERADAVKEAFLHSWNGYTQYAFPHDELHPVSNGYGDSRNGWGASTVDALSTALVMGLGDVVDQILDHIATIDYSKTSSEVSLFETTIRYLGGMLSGYDLLNGPLSDLATNQTNVDALLAQSVKLADVLKFAFNTTSGVPHNNLNIGSKTTDGSSANGLAVTGTLVLEWTRLADLTGKTEYAELSQKAESYLLDPQPTWNEPWPGMLGSNIDIATGKFTDASGGWGGGTDSFYEYLIKMYTYDSEKYGLYKDRWVLAAESTMEHLTSHPSSRPEITFVADYRNTTLSLTSGHLNCFHGGNFILGGEVLDRQDLIDYGLLLVDGCHDTYISTATHIGPEAFGWDSSKVPSDQKDFYNQNGFFITASYYDLRPEVIESFYYAYRSTGDPKYQDWAWDAFVAINATARTDSGFTAFDNVNVVGGGEKYDNQESFWFAEVLKYSYLIQAADAEYQVFNGGVNKWVFNTEAHPFLVNGSPI